MRLPVPPPEDSPVAKKLAAALTQTEAARDAIEEFVAAVNAYTVETNGPLSEEADAVFFGLADLFGPLRIELETALRWLRETRDLAKVHNAYRHN